MNREVHRHGNEHIDRDTASRLGVTPQAIDDTLYDAFGQRQISTIFTQLNLYRVVLEVKPGMGKDPNADAKPAPPPPPKPEVPDGPVRVGGDVKAPTVVDRVEPKYTDTARTARVAGVVIVEAIIDKTGRVDQVKVLKGLPMGLSEEAERAVREWRFKPGTMNGQPVAVIFNLTVNFQLN